MAARWMGLEIIVLSEASQAERDKYYIYMCIYIAYVAS